MSNDQTTRQMEQRSDSGGSFAPSVELINGKNVFTWNGSMTGSQSKVAVLEDFARLNPGSSITVIFTSGGGGVDDCRESYNRMLMLREFFKIHFTFVVLEAKSCAFWFIQCADVRVGMPHSAFMYHCVKWELSNTPRSQRELDNARKSMDRNQREFTAILCSRSSDPQKTIEDTLKLIDDDQDHFFTSEEAVANGWLDSVHKPEFKAVQEPVDLAGIEQLTQAN